MKFSQVFGCFHTSAMGIFETQPVGNIGTCISEGHLVGTGKYSRKHSFKYMNKNVSARQW